MGIFVRKKAIAVTWTPRSCNAVRLEGNSGSCEVVAAWSGECASGGDALPALVARAIKEVGGDDSIYVIAGGSGQGWGMADLTMPSLKSEELRNALEFEVRKQTPLPGDKLHWGYRRLPSDAKAADGGSLIRLYYVRSEHWESWLKAIGSLHHVDALLPAPVALDPVLAGTTFQMLPDGQSIGYEYRPENGKRVIVPLAGDCSSADGLALPNVKLGVLAGKPADEHNGYARAIVLAMYGMTDAANRDHGTLYQLPEHLMAHRYVALKGIAACLLVYLVCLFVFTLTGTCQGKAARIRRVGLAIEQTRKELVTINRLLDPKVAERSTLLRKELQDNMEDRPDFPSVLMEITRAVNPPSWVSQSMEWKDGNVTVQIQSPTKDLELASRLEASPYLGDVTERLSSFNQGSNAYVQRFEMVARFDTSEEKELLKLRQEKARQRAEEAERAKKAAEMEAAGVEAEDDGGEDDAEEVADEIVDAAAVDAEAAAQADANASPQSNEAAAAENQDGAQYAAAEAEAEEPAEEAAEADDEVEASLI